MDMMIRVIFKATVHFLCVQAEDDGLTGKDKIESYLRKSRVPETKVRPLAVKLWEQCRKEYDDQLQKLTADTTALKTALQGIISQPLDLLLYGKANRTSLKGAGGAGLSLEELVKKVADNVELLETDIALCFDSCERHVQTKVGAKSVPLAVRDAFVALETDYDILYDKYHELRREKDDAVYERAKTQHRSVALEESSLQVEKEFRKLAGQNREMYEHLKELKAYRGQHKNSTQHMAEDITRLKKQVQWYQESNAIVSKDLLKLQETCTQLQVQNADQAKEIRRLKDPDKEMIYKIQRLQTELTEAKTANRKLELERGTVKTSLVKVQAQLDSVQKDRSTLTKLKQKLQKENEKVKTTNKKLKLSS